MDAGRTHSVVVGATKALVAKTKKDEKVVPCLSLFQQNIQHTFQVHHKFRFEYAATLHLAIDILDRFLSLHVLDSRKKLQLVGLACLLIASKIEEMRPAVIDELGRRCGFGDALQRSCAIRRADRASIRSTYRAGALQRMSCMCQRNAEWL